MARQTAEVKINPDVLKWIIDSSGWEISELAEKLEENPNSILKWTSNRQPIELKKLEKIASYVKRPLAIFFLPKPPQQSTLTDFRKGARNFKKLSKDSLFVIRESRYLQSIARDMLTARKISLKPKINPDVTLDDDPEKIATVEREHLGFESTKGLLSSEAKEDIRNRYNKLREIVESLNIFVFQASIPIEEIRGFTLSEQFPRVIVINSADSYPARIFSLMHEYAHVILNEDGICLPDFTGVGTKSNKKQRVETWCNKFAAAILVPRVTFVEEFSQLKKKYEEPSKIIDQLSRRFRVSKQVVTYRVIELYRNKQSIQGFYEELQKLLRIKPAKKKGGFVHPVDKCLSRKGRKYVSLILNAQKNKIINYSNAADYLNLKVKHFDRLQDRL